MRKSVNKPVLVVAVIAHVALAALSWRDISNRPAERIRGPKAGWRLATVVNTLGSMAYWTIGRR